MTSSVTYLKPPKTPPFFASLRGYKAAWIRYDLLAGLAVWAVLIPESLAYASIAGVSPVVGLYAALPALVLYPIFGSSKHLIVGPMSATAALSASIVAGLAPAGDAKYAAYTAALALMTGVLCALAGLLKFGFLASFISDPVLKGFIVGLALTIIIGQVPKLFGVKKAEGDFFEQLWGVISQLGSTNIPTLIVGVLSLALVMALKRWLPLVPGALVAVAFGVAAVLLFDLSSKGVSIVGHIEAGFPTVGVPLSGSIGDYLQLIGPAGGLLIVGYAEALGAAKTYAARAGYDVDANKELIGMGAANIGSGLMSGMVVNGSLSKTAVNGSSGARSGVSSLFVAVLTLLTLLFFTPLFEDLPEATLAAIVIAAVIELVDIPAIVRLFRVSTPALSRIYGMATRADFIGAVAAMLGVLIFDTLPGLIIGLVVSLLVLLYRVAKPNIAVLGKSPNGGWVDLARNDNASAPAGVLVVRVEAGLFFGNADHVREQLRLRAKAADADVVIVDARTTPSIDVSATEMLGTLNRDLAREGIALALARDVGQVRDVLAEAGEGLPPAYATVDEAIAGVKSA
jgi:high affinity sulfate transporter 1